MVSLILVGKTTDKHLEALIADYQQRLTHYLPFEIKVIPDLKQGKLSFEQQKTLEGERILDAIPNNAQVILLDERGKQFRSIDFAAHLQKRLASTPNITFVIGGPYGFSKAVYDRANAMLSLSLMTFSHQMIRLLFIEQLYRAMTILRNEPYHHE
ncbi:MAG: 23S rRNA (pseudouridine(1915)-N(3))-methyltransferase RlmH [Paludibacteraceae bacterium]|nr:23S rRNA (pseudouridine(1915)-N(3))-methyltransferase RlmH [Paludibacteraceae bacterium]